jgi:hypothetical protein
MGDAPESLLEEVPGGFVGALIIIGNDLVGGDGIRHPVEEGDRKALLVQ